MNTGGLASATILGINDGVAPTATGPNGDLPTIVAVRLVVKPKPSLPTDPNDPGAFIDIFTDISGLFVISNESGWYEGWMIHDLQVPAVASSRKASRCSIAPVRRRLVEAGYHQSQVQFPTPMRKSRL